ncbi:PTS sugar transporter subunit IIB [Thermoflexus sp.]|uniref:PTS sugar transporter subunit IIB n=1 Tax=Thermoflexus sp. TaxID=1969742 RepID=UPI0035E404A6
MNQKQPIRVVAACGLGTGTALYLKMTVEEILKKAGIPAVVETADATLAPTMNADIIVTGPDLAEMFSRRAKAREIVSISNYGNKAEIQEKLLAAVQRLGG